jgi:hypothetical protein
MLKKSEFIALGVALYLAGCTSTPDKQTNNFQKDRETVQTELGDELSLKADRESLAEMRKDIPKEKQQSNDELALHLNLMKEGREPSEVRSKFYKIITKRRDDHRHKVTKLRDTYRKEETKRRDEYLKASKQKREEFMKSKRDSADRKEFYEEQDKARREFFADERERRNNFESELNAQSKDFESYMRERQKEFDEQYRLYSKTYYEKQREKDKAKGPGSSVDPYKRLLEAPAEPLGTEDN